LVPKATRPPDFDKSSHPVLMPNFTPNWYNFVQFWYNLVPKATI
jgi:hypothetical protein